MPIFQKPKRKASKMSQQIKPPHQALPMEPEDNILLVGEGNFSFAAALVDEHGCANLTATSYDSEQGCNGKYHTAAKNLNTLQETGMTVLFDMDAAKLHKSTAIKKRAGSGFDLVIFNFPHVGGKSTNVNRQVRYNQGMPGLSQFPAASLYLLLSMTRLILSSSIELVVSFFASAIKVISPTAMIAVTLFEGEPYSLWNVRDLARHCKLKLVRSFKFQSGRYPGYAHSRTLGDVVGGGGWKGEEREARTYLFQSSEPESGTSQEPGSGKKRKRDKSSSCSDSE
ncbi:MAG: hypothetical protein M1814_002842 [Vezdaea aestivalis]|nr:MAG: hypothetical protein M1814_002842 [Vezdaea aestivalis]